LNFSPVAANNLVYFGAVQAQVTSASGNSLTTVVPAGATYAPITLTIAGLVAAAPAPFQPTFAGGNWLLSPAGFGPRFDLPAGDGAHRSVIADFDGDARPDIAVANVYGHTVSLFRNISSVGTLTPGSFAGRVDLPAPGGVSDNPYGFGTADVDGDGKLDLVACDRLGNHICVYRNDASPGNLTAASFSPYVSFPVGADPRYARVADLDADGRPDIVSCNFADNTISILRNVGAAGVLEAGSFAPAITLPAGAGPYDVSIGDLDGDQKPDLAVVNADGFSVSLYQNLSTPGTLDTNSFAPRVDFPAPDGSITITLGDVDGDVRPDLVIGSYRGYSLSVYRNQATSGILDTNSFAPRVDFTTGHWTHNVALADLNGDAKPDVVAAGELDSYLSLFQNLSTPGSFTAGSLGSRVQLGAGWNAWGISAGDLDGDGRPDLVFCNAYDDSLSIYQNLGASAPVITQQPLDQTVSAGGTAQFSVGTIGTEPLTFQWDKAGTPIPGATDPVFTLSNIQFGDAGNYSVTVTNEYGSATSRLAVLTVRPPPVCTPLPEGAVAWWPGESNTWDVLGGFDGSFVSQPAGMATYTAGKTGTALRFNGTSYLQVTHGGGLNLGSGQGLTIEGWVRPDVSSILPVAEWSIPLSRTNAGIVGVGLLLGNGGPGTIEATIAETNSAQKTLTFRSAPHAVSNLVWQHVALTLDRSSGAATIYVNGLPVAQTNAAGIIPNTAGDFVLGYRRAGTYSGARFRGAVDEFTVYNRALAPAEIQAILAADEAGKCPPPPLPCYAAPAAIAAWWRGESNTLDSVAGNTGSLVPTNIPGAFAYKPGAVNSAFAFLGQNFVSIPRSEVLDLGTGDGLTIEAWIRPRQSRPMPIVEWTDTNNFGVNLWVSYYRGPMVLEANLIDTGGANHLVQSPVNSLATDQWQHVAVCYDKASGQAALYVNGNSVATTNLGSFTPRTDLPLNLGYHPPNSSTSGGYGSPPSSPYWFYGEIDEVALYRRGLNPGEIRNLARSHPGKCLELPPAIGSQPRDQVVAEGGTAMLTVAAGGSGPLSYQWFTAGRAIPLATTATLTLAPAQLADTGSYFVIVSNVLGTATSRMAMLTVLPANQCLPTPWGAVAFWRGESNIVDELGNHPAAWGTNTPAAYTFGAPGQGKVNTAFRFTGVNYLQIPGNADLNVGAGGGFTVEGWIKPDSLSGQSLVDWNDGKGYAGVGLMYARTGPGVLEVTLTDTNAYLTSERTITFATSLWAVGSPTNPVPGWTHVALTFERVAGKAVLFVNGKPAAERTIGPVLVYGSQNQRMPFTPATSGDLYFGWRRSGPYSGLRFHGAMDEMTVYYRALTALEIQAICVAGNNGKCSPEPSCLPLAAEVGGWWRGETNLLDSCDTNHGVAVLGGPIYSNGVSDLAFQFASPGKYIRVPAAPALNVGASEGMTFEAWVNPGSPGLQNAIAAWNNGYNEPGVSFGSSPTRGPYYFEANLVDTSGNSHVMIAPYRAIAEGKWQHVAVTYDKTTCLGVIFINGAPVTVTNLGLFTPRTTGSLYLGYRPPGPYPGSGWGYVGGLDEVMIHHRALSSSEISASYRNAANRCVEPPLIVQQPASLRVNAGNDVALSVQATGNPRLRFQWLQNGRPIYDDWQKPAASASLPTLILTNVSARNEGAYQVIVSNAFGFAVSSSATLLVNYPPVADASATLTQVISPNDHDAVAVLDGSRSSDPDHDTLSYEWFRDGVGTPVATGVVAVATLPLGTNLIELAVSDGLLARTNRVTVEIITTDQALERLLEILRAGSGNPQALIASVRAALASIGRGQPATAIHQLQAFINKVRARLERSEPALAAQLIADAQAIIDALNSGRTPANREVKIVSITNNAQGKPHLKINAAADRVLIVETSTDMVNWLMIGVGSRCGGDEYEFSDEQTPAGEMRFYRVVLP
jgi:hypothetical protein